MSAEEVAGAIMALSSVKVGTRGCFAVLVCSLDETVILLLANCRELSRSHWNVE